MDKYKIKLIAIICLIIGIVLIISGLIVNKEKNTSKIFTNDDYNINNNGGGIAVKIDDYYYVMGAKFFLKIDKNNNIVTNIGKENDISSFDDNPYMQIHSDYIYYAVGSYYKKIYRYNYKNNTIELYTDATKINKESSIVSTYFIRGDNLIYQPYSKKYYYSINLKNNELIKIEHQDLYAYLTPLNLEDNMYKNNLIYSKSGKLKFLNISANEAKDIIPHKCNNFIVYNNQIYYEYNSAIYKSNIDGTNETLVYNGDYNDLMTIYDNYLYVGKGYQAKIIDLSTGKEINNIGNCKNYSIAVDKIICTYKDNSSYSYNLDGSNKKLIYDNQTNLENSNDKNVNDNTNNNQFTDTNKNDQTLNEAINSTQIIADVHFLTKADGGLHTPFFSGKIFQYQFTNSSMYNGSCKFPSGVEMVSPGDDLELTITISDSINESLNVGTKFTIYKDSTRVIGNGVIKKITQ